MDRTIFDVRGRATLVFVGLLVMSSGCGSASSSGSSGEGTGSSGGTGGPAITTIGAEGGTITSDDGAVSIRVPAGALVTRQTVGIVRGAAADVSTDLPGGSIDAVYKLEPDGLVFAGPAQVTIQLGQFPSNRFNGIPVALNVRGATRELLGEQGVTFDNTTGKATLSGTLSHFSKLAIRSNISSADSVAVLFDGIPSRLANGETFEAVVTVTHPASSALRSEQVLYRDASSGQISLSAAINQVLGTLERGAGKVLSAHFPFSCSDGGGTGVYDGSVVLQLNSVAGSFAPYFLASSLSPPAPGEFFIRFVTKVECGGSDGSARSEQL